MRPLNDIPVNRTAALVMGKGYEFSPSLPETVRDQEQEFAIKKHWDWSSNKSRGFIDFTGLRIGRLKVIGLARDYKKRWVVRCSCSAYTLRTAKALKNTGNSDYMMCESCRYLEHLKWKDGQAK